MLGTVNGGEAVWVNANAAFTMRLPPGTAIASASLRGIASGWSLNAVGDSLTPSDFNKAIGATTPAAGEIPINITALWAWDAVLAKWYYFAPSLEKSAGLANFIQSKNYLDFGARVLDPTMGFWVSKQ